MKILWIMIMLLIGTLSPRASYAGEAELNAALQRLETMHGFEADPELKELVPAFYALPQNPDPATIRKLFADENVAQWSSRVADFLGLVTLLFDSMTPEEQAQWARDFHDSRAQWETFQMDITRYVRSIHPGFSSLGLAPLQAERRGRGVRIVVFDVFEADVLDRQRQDYPEARILDPKVFGRPVALSHGNTVIDIILALAPAATIIPVASDAKSYAAAMEELAEWTDVDIINMSRAFPEDPLTHAVDKKFEQALRRWTRQGILVKSLGNTGTDLHGAPTRVRVDKGLGPVSSLTAYDLKLIRELHAADKAVGLEIFALNLALFADDLALTATIPGDVRAVQERTLAVPAEGIYSPATETFESGSSFAAPQITAWLALLLEERQARHPEEPWDAARRSVYERILNTADREGRPAEEWGRGRPRL